MTIVMILPGFQFSLLSVRISVGMVMLKEESGRMVLENVELLVSGCDGENKMEEVV